MSKISYYQLALESLEKASQVYKDIDSEDLYGGSLLDLARYAILAEVKEKAQHYIRKAIEYSPINAALLLSDKELVSSTNVIEGIIKEITTENYSDCYKILTTLGELYIPIKKELVELSGKVEQVKNLIKMDNLLDSIKATKLTISFNELIEQRGYITIEKHKIEEQIKRHKREEKKRQERIKREKERRREEKREKEREKKEEEEREKKEEEEREKEEQEEVKRKQRLKSENERIAIETKRATEQAKLEKKRLNRCKLKLIIKWCFIIAMLVIIICYVAFIIINTIKNRTQYESLESNTFFSRSNDSDERFISYYFIFDDTRIIQVRALPNKQITVPSDSKYEGKYQIQKWSTEIPKTSIFSYESFHSTLPNSNENINTVLPGEKIQIVGADRFYFPNWRTLPYRINFDGNGIEGLDWSVEVPYSTNFIIPSPTVPIPEILEFIGWSESKFNPKISFLSGDSIVMPGNDLYLYALFKLTDAKAYLRSIVVIITIPTTIFILSIMTLITSNLIIIRIFLLLTGLLQLAFIIWDFHNRHKIRRIIFLYLSLTNLFWAFLPHLYLIVLLENL